MPPLTINEAVTQWWTQQTENTRGALIVAAVVSVMYSTRGVAYIINRKRFDHHQDQKLVAEAFEEDKRSKVMTPPKTEGQASVNAASIRSTYGGSRASPESLIGTISTVDESSPTVVVSQEENARQNNQRPAESPEPTRSEDDEELHLHNAHRSGNGGAGGAKRKANLSARSGATNSNNRQHSQGRNASNDSLTRTAPLPPFRTGSSPLPAKRSTPVISAPSPSSHQHSNNARSNPGKQQRGASNSNAGIQSSTAAALNLSPSLAELAALKKDNGDLRIELDRLRADFDRHQHTSERERKDLTAELEMASAQLNEWCTYGESMQTVVSTLTKERDELQQRLANGGGSGGGERLTKRQRDAVVAAVAAALDGL